MNKIFIAFLLSFSLFFTACFDSSPKCDDETVKSLVFDILEENEWLKLKYLVKAILTFMMANFSYDDFLKPEAFVLRKIQFLPTVHEL